MKIATLSIGDELIFGEVVDTNAAHISERLYSVGFKVQRQLTVGDNEQDIVEAIEMLAVKCDVVVVTGGLGPTVDDITARSAAKITGHELVLNEEALARLQRFSEKLGGNLHPSNEKQALMPANATLIPNPVGTACGFYLTHNGRFLFFLPGVPGEMACMLDETVIPFIVSRVKRRTFLQTKVFKVFGPSEAEVDALMDGVADEAAGVSVAFCVNFPEIQVKLRVEGHEEAVVAELLTRAGDKARQRLNGYVFAEDGETIDTVVASLFRETGFTLSLAESCTGGLVAKRITDIPGSSAYFLEGIVTYSNTAKTQLLDVPQRLLDEKGAVSSEVAVAMALGARKLSGSDIALAVTGIAGPDGGTAEKPVGTVYMALAGSNGCQAKRYTFHGDREEIRLITSFMAMDWLRKRLLSLRSAEVTD
ncbi:competence/damage-inducible protein A [Geotalea uraniireducens]|uniref:CinA-like protein n=1 Tax=Geotalea uraniireducens (strain Rf4) TaxID=351605 RepID=CINAL_GEOUR|nr:competence/damage-inducible protein A [Geotalea uraniireducens]A5GDB4.1 RecName: Full=CinA-like protein [Geotalea uraniireducens Rf4]ABQ24433.1 competence/damage-inducible protein cinA [Geotalea uraniireducens Rf4]